MEHLVQVELGRIVPMSPVDSQTLMSGVLMEVVYIHSRSSYLLPCAAGLCCLRCSVFECELGVRVSNL